MKSLEFTSDEIESLNERLSSNALEVVESITTGDSRELDKVQSIIVKSTLFGNENIYVWGPLESLSIYEQTIEHVNNEKIETLELEEIRNLVPKITGNWRDLIDEKNQYSRYIGLYGYISFELSRLLEKYTHRQDKTKLPLLFLMVPKYCLIEQENKYIFIELRGKVLQRIPKVRNRDVFVEESKIVTTNISYQDYLDALKKLNSYITAGDIYQANYTQSFTIPNQKKEYLKLFLSIIAQKRVDYASYLNLQSFKVFSLSPELFMKIRNGKVITQPIKGTRPRGSSEKEDVELISKLRQSEKDIAELSMIVDLLRNDLGRSADPGSVEVTKHAEVHSFENVHHLISTVTAKIPTSVQQSWRMLLRAFPGGSISGVPKLRALEIIEELETTTREIYTGSIGFMNIFGDLQFNVAIRTAVITNDNITFNAGGGIVLDSDPVEEYIESLHKAKHLARYFDKTFVGHLYWINGEIKNQDKDFPKITDHGCFETIRINNGKIINLKSHLKRFKLGIDYFDFDCVVPSEQDIKQFVNLNVSEDAQLNIYAFQGSKEKENEIITLMKLQKYEEPDLPISLFLDQGQMNIPEEINYGVKSLNYSRYREKTQTAKDLGHWDSIIVKQGKILEGGRCNIYAFEDKWITPSKNVVRGTVREKLIEQNVVEAATLNLDDLDEFDEIAISNALIGILPVDKIYENERVIWSRKSKWRFKELMRIF